MLRQSAYDYERKQYNTVVSGAMKMLNAIDDARLADSAADAAANHTATADAAVLHEVFGILLRSLYPARCTVTSQRGFAGSSSSFFLSFET